MQAWESMKDELRAYKERDPAARDWLEIALCMPGLHAIWWYRLAHWLWHWNWPLVARILSQLARLLTGVEIHPAAKLGKRVFIDHGMGVVIGATAEVGDDCSIYHGATLGGVTQSFTGKRHPTLEADVIIGAGAQVLGPVVVGRGARVGSNAVVVKDVPAGVTVVGVPAREVSREDKSEDDSTPPKFVAYGSVADDNEDDLKTRVAALESQLAKMRGGKADSNKGGKDNKDGKDGGGG